MTNQPSPQERNDALQELQRRLTWSLEDIRRCFINQDEIKITLVVRNPNKPDNRGDVCMTDENPLDLEKVFEVIKRIQKTGIDPFAKGEK
jgi:hypothetical protein